MEESRKFLKHMSHYLTGSVLTTIAGFISFPIFTRALSVSDYGIMNLISSLFMFTMAFGKFGIQNAAVRFFSEFRAGKKGASLAEFYATLFWSTVCTAGIATVILWIGIRFIPDTPDNRILTQIVSFACVMIFLSSVVGIMMNFLRAEQETVVYNSVGIAWKYLSLSLSVVLVLYWIRGLTGFYVGQITAEAAAFVFLILFITRKRNLGPMSFSPAFWKEAVSYGFPLIWFEFANIILAFGDRVMINMMMDTQALGIYSAGYNISMFIWPLFIDPLSLSITPLYMNLWAEKGLEETKTFLTKSLTQFLAIAIPAGFGLSFLGKEVIVFFASSKYADAYRIIPFVVAGLVIYGTYSIIGAGIHIYKKTYLLTISIVVSCVINIILNIVLIPRLGILGSALATMFAYIFLVVIIGWYAFKLVPFTINYRAIIRYFICSGIMVYVISRIACENHIINLFARITAGAFVYGILIYLLDRDVREAVKYHAAPKIAKLLRRKP